MGWVERRSGCDGTLPEAHPETSADFTCKSSAVSADFSETSKKGGFPGRPATSGLLDAHAARRRSRPARRSAWCAATECAEDIVGAFLPVRPHMRSRTQWRPSS